MSFLQRLSGVMLLAMASAGCSSGDHEERLLAAGPNPSLEALQRVADTKAGARLFGACARCHTILPGGIDKAGPNLFGIIGAPVAGQGRYGYTVALKGVGGVWTPARMDAWLASPQRFAPGNNMAFAGVPDALDRADLIAYLASQSAPPER